MTELQPPKPRPQITGNSGLNYVAWQLSRRGWHVMPTIRNARGSDLIVINEDETVVLGIQSKALSKRNAVPLGVDIENLRSDWWIITIHANSDNPACYVLRLDEVRALAGQDKNGGAWWLEAKHYDKSEFRDAWHRLLPEVVEEEEAEREDMPRQNGVRRPKPDTLCGRAWAVFEEISQNRSAPASIGESLEIARERSLNEGNVRAEFYNWRKFNGISG